MTREELNVLKTDVFKHYCSDKIKCADPYHEGCNINDVDVLSISCIDGDKSRPRFSNNIKLLKKLKKENYPAGYQVLCENCQWIKQAKQWNRFCW
jgi:hypothetical protein